MTVNAMIPLSYQSPQLPTQQDIYKNQLAQMQVQEAQRQVQSRNALAQVFQNPANLDDKGMPTQNALTQIMQIDPDKGMALQNHLAQMQEQQQIQQTNAINQKRLSLDITETQNNHLEKIATGFQVRYDDLIASGADKKKAIEIVSEEKNRAIDEAQKSGLLTDAQAASMKGTFNPDANKAFIASAPSYKQVLAERAKAKEDDLKAKAEVEKERHDQATEAAANKREDRLIAAVAAKNSQPDVPSGYRMTKDGNLEFIPGGPADPATKAGKLGAREQVFLQRTMTAATEAARDLENVVQLPMTSSSGLFGGRHQGPSLLDASQEALTNKMTSQDVQSYNTLSSGFQRSLASIEAAGLAPPGSLAHQMDSVIFKEGDTNLTKLQKLAQTRQIVEAGLESTLANPRIPDEQRAQMEKVMGSIQKSVPFTQSDLMALQKAQEKNPEITLKDVMTAKQKIMDQQKKGADKAPTKISSDADYDKLPSGALFIGPDGKTRSKP